MSKSTPDIASACGDPLFVSNHFVKPFPKRSVVDVSFNKNRHPLIMSSSNSNPSNPSTYLHF